MSENYYEEYGAKATDTADKDITEYITKTIEKYNEETMEWEIIGQINDPHTNPWSVPHIDTTQPGAQYRIRYNVKDEENKPAEEVTRLINIRQPSGPKGDPITNHVGGSTFGDRGIAITPDGDTIAAGASGYFVEVYHWVNGAWALKGNRINPPTHWESTTYPKPRDTSTNFGRQVQLSEDGNRLFVAATNWSSQVTFNSLSPVRMHKNEGTVVIYDWNGSTWVKSSEVNRDTYPIVDYGARDEYGYFSDTLNVPNDGKSMLLGHSSGSAYRSLYAPDKVLTFSNTTVPGSAGTWIYRSTRGTYGGIWGTGDSFHNRCHTISANGRWYVYGNPTTKSRYHRRGMMRRFAVGEINAEGAISGARGKPWSIPGQNPQAQGSQPGSKDSTELSGYPGVEADYDPPEMIEITDDGNTVIVGSANTNSVHIMTWNSTAETWDEAQEIIKSTGQFGHRVKLMGDTCFAVTQPDSSKTYIYEKSGSTWLEIDSVDAPVSGMDASRVIGGGKGGHLLLGKAGTLRVVRV